MHVEYHKMHAVASKYFQKVISSCCPSPAGGTESRSMNFMLDSFSDNSHDIAPLDCASPSKDVLFPTEVFSSDEEMFASFC